jgi:hypothetical protein
LYCLAKRRTDPDLGREGRVILVLPPARQAPESQAHDLVPTVGGTAEALRQSAHPRLSLSGVFGGLTMPVGSPPGFGGPVRSVGGGEGLARAPRKIPGGDARPGPKVEPPGRVQGVLSVSKGRPS